MFVLSPILWGSFYALSKSTLQDIDPLLFTVAELAASLPLAMLLLWIRRKGDFRSAFKAALPLGLCLFSVILLAIWALNFTTATNTAFFPALNGFFAAMIAQFILGRRVSYKTWIAGLLSCTGGLLVLWYSSAGGGNFRGDALALMGAVGYTGYIFLTEHYTRSGDLWLIFALELVILSGLSFAVFLLAGGPYEFRKLTDPKIFGNILYVGIATTFIPTAISIFFQRYVDPIIVALIFISEPLWGAFLSWLLNGEKIALWGYVGGGIIALGALLGIAAEFTNAPRFDGRSDRI